MVHRRATWESSGTGRDVEWGDVCESEQLGASQWDVSFHIDSLFGFESALLRSITGEILPRLIFRQTTKVRNSTVWTIRRTGLFCIPRMTIKLLPAGSWVFSSLSRCWPLIMNALKTMISSTTFCLRACSDASYCPTSYDEMGCYFFTSNGIGWDGVYQDCVGDDGDRPGVYVDEGQTVTYTQGGGEVPTFSIPAVSECAGGSVSVEATEAAETAVEATAAAENATAAETATATENTWTATSWLPVETCTPCTGAATATAGTEQVGVTRVAAIGARDGATSSGECCFTTWTSAVSGGTLSGTSGTSGTLSGTSGTLSAGTVASGASTAGTSDSSSSSGKRSGRTALVVALVVAALAGCCK